MQNTDPRLAEVEKFEKECDAFQDQFCRQAYLDRHQERKHQVDTETEKGQALADQIKQQQADGEAANQRLALLVTQKAECTSKLAGKLLPFYT